MGQVLNHQHEADGQSPCNACWTLAVEARPAPIPAKAVGSGRRHDVPGCPRCDREPTVFHPAHDASPRCDSGGYEHCSCDVCF